MAVQPIDGPGFDNVKNTKHSEPRENPQRLHRDSPQRNPQADEFVPDDAGVIVRADRGTGPITQPDSQQRRQENDRRVQQQRLKGEEQITRQRRQRSKGARGFGRQARAEAKGEENPRILERYFIHNHFIQRKSL